MTIKYIIFDWDGTLADTYPVISGAYEHIFATLNVSPIPYDEVKRITSTLQNKDTLAFLFGDRKKEAAKAYYDYIEKYHVSKLEAMAGAKDLLLYCKKNNIKSYLLTNKKTQYVAEEIEKLGFSKLFDKVVAAGEYAEDKPHSVATHAIFNNDLPPSNQILVLGDGEADYQTARTYDADGKKTTCVIYDPKGKYDGSTPDYKINDLTQLVTIINTLNTQADSSKKQNLLKDKIQNEKSFFKRK